MLRLGFAVWAHKGWLGGFYPPKTSAKRFLDLYSRRMSAVEGNTTFYATPDRQTLEKWAESTPEDFHFCPKLPKLYTHNGALAPSIQDCWSFADQMMVLGERLGPIFAQLPPSYSSKRLSDLTVFLRAWRSEACPLALEVRHLDWFGDPYQRRLNRLLASMNVARVLLDTRPIFECEDDPQVDNPRRKPNLPLNPVVTAHFTFVRYIGHPEIERNAPYLEAWAARVEAWLEQDLDVYFFLHCPNEDKSPAIARMFYDMLQARRVEMEPIEWDIAEDEPEVPQLTLF